MEADSCIHKTITASYFLLNAYNFELDFVKNALVIFHFSVLWMDPFEFYKVVTMAAYVTYN